MAPVARELSRVAGVFEPLQATITIQPHAEELRAIIEEWGIISESALHSWNPSLFCNSLSK